MVVFLLSVSIVLIFVVWFFQKTRTDLPGLLEPGDMVFDGDCVGTFQSYAKKSVGRIHNEGQSPGIYLDPNKALVDFSGHLEFRSTQDLVLTKGCSNKPAPVFQKLSNLPETPFCEGDVVEVVATKEQKTLIQIDYLNLEGRAYFCKGVSLPFSVTELNLVARGPVYLHYQGQRPLFRTLKDELEFQIIVGAFKASSFQSKSLDSAKKFLEKTQVHAIRKLPDASYQCIYLDRKDLAEEARDMSLFQHTLSDALILMG